MSARALNARRRTNNAGPLAEPDAIDVFAACSAQRWARADCIAREARHTTQVTVPVFTRTRDGRMETMFVPDRFVAPGFDRTSCMRGLGFVRAPAAAADASNR